MKLKDLRTYINSLDPSLDNIEIVRPSGDHSYVRSRVVVTDAEFDPRNGFFEYYDDANMGTGSKKTQVLLVE